MAMLNEKKLCPNAPRNTPLSTLEKSGLKRNCTPLPALGNRHAETTMTYNNMNNVGIIIFEAFSIPPLTPWMMTK